MKKVFMVSLFALVTIISFGQKEVSDTLDFNRVKEDGYLKSYKNNHLFESMKLPDGSILSVGEELIVGKPSSMNTSKQANNGLFSGNVVTTSAFNYLINGRVGLSVMAGMQYLPGTYTNRKIKIKEIKKGWTIVDLNDNSVGTVLGITEAINTGEIINPKAAMTREQAIAKLKEAKDLVDLGMMSKEDFEKLKLELTPLIIKN